jgi:sugar lactone lactonase YvrE
LAWARPDVIASGLQFLTETIFAGSELFRSPVTASWNSSARPLTLSQILRPRRGAYGPAGLPTDSAGRLYNALYNGDGIAIVGADAQLIRQINLPRHHHRSRHHSNLAIDERFLDVTAIDDEPGGSYRGEILRFPNPLLK